MINEYTILSGVGGTLIQLLSLLELRSIPKNDRPNFKDWVYWIPYVINPLLGLVLGYVYFDGKQDIDKILAIHIGISSPLILRTMATLIPKGFL